MTIKIPETLKHAVISLLIAVAITAVSTLLEGLITIVHDVNSIPAGLTVGVLYFLKMFRAVETKLP